eukprot:10713496-Prorocentrum_lima.AAC.1
MPREMIVSQDEYMPVSPKASASAAPDLRGKEAEPKLTGPGGPMATVLRALADTRLGKGMCSG